MLKRPLALRAFALLLFRVASAQEPAHLPAMGYEDTYQINAIGNLQAGDSYVNIVNAGFHMTTPNSHGYVCANVYVFDQAEEMISCCVCPVSRNGLKTLSARSDLISNTLTPGVPPAIVVKLVFTTPPLPGGENDASTCNASLLPMAAAGTVGPLGGTFAPGGNGNPLFPYIPGAYATGNRAWATNLHAAPTTPVSWLMTETRFEEVPLQDNERALLASFCGFIQANGSGFGICKSCKAGYQGAASK